MRLVFQISFNLTSSDVGSLTTTSYSTHKEKMNMTT